MTKREALAKLVEFMDRPIRPVPTTTETECERRVRLLEDTVERLELFEESRVIRLLMKLRMFKHLGSTNFREKFRIERELADTRHTFISMLAENGATDTEIVSMSGHVSKKTLARYSHARNSRKLAAIDRAFNKIPVSAQPQGKKSGDSPQNHPQSGVSETEVIM